MYYKAEILANVKAGLVGTILSVSWLRPDDLINGFLIGVCGAVGAIVGRFIMSKIKKK